MKIGYLSRISRIKIISMIWCISVGISMGAQRLLHIMILDYGI